MKYPLLLKQGLLKTIWLLVEPQGADYSTLTPLLDLEILKEISEKSPKKSHEYNFSWKPEQELSDCLTSNGIIFHVGNKTIADTITLLYYHLINKDAQSIKDSNRKTVVRPYKEPVQHIEPISQKDFMQTFNHHKTKNPQLSEQTEKMAQILLDTLQQPTKIGAEEYLNSKQGEFKEAFDAAKKAATPTQVYFTKPFIFGSSVLFISALLGYFAYQKYRIK